ncbi:MAG TPA: hypothetical protein VK078_00690 [Pseudogracilibacillus sp.]|nr:hypothetical protein [Pseudogracilibacillus sp.]
MRESTFLSFVSRSSEVTGMTTCVGIKHLYDQTTKYKFQDVTGVIHLDSLKTNRVAIAD